MKSHLLCTSLLSAALLGVSIIGQPISTVSAATDAHQSTASVTSTMIYWNSSAHLVTSAYSNVTSSNNIFDDRPLVTNKAGNKGSIKVRVINQRGAQVGSVKTIGVGKSVRLDTIYWDSGTYNIQAKAVSAAGTYAISID
ncbi:hypothetical protein ACFQ3L_11460 [Lacticaseibacillus jixianensis]|uniref:Uncharacterized protein n=1 Tax=Lacticaseibacillus jixianensis TaxID=2486012 RepID=A0ABW4BD98_9LACO|nr:hypothetical protein [Lacticaseibacillus jixianensis]